MLHARLVRRFWPGWTVAVVIFGLLLAGCTPDLDPEQYGDVVHELPEIGDIHRPYSLPELDEGAPPAGQGEK